MMTRKIPENQFIIICGLSFAGKSTLAKAIAERFDYREVDVDETKFKIYGESIKDEDLRPDDWVRIYAETDKLIENMLEAGKSVVDASRNFAKAERTIAKSIAFKVGVPILTIYVDTPEEIARQRLLENRRTFLRRDITDKDFEDVIRAMDTPTADENPLIFHYFDEINRWIAENSAEMAPKG